jgi:hypothetical protein
MEAWRNPARGLLLAIAGSATTIAQGATIAEDAVVERQGRHYQVVLHRRDLPETLAGQLADQAVQALEALWAQLERLLPGKPPAMSVIHIYRTAADQQKALASQPPAFPRNGVLDAGGRGHVVLYPELTDAQFAITGVPHATLDSLRFVAAERAVRICVPDPDEANWMRHLIVMGAIELTTNPRHLPGIDGDHDRRRAYLAEMQRRNRHNPLEGYLLMEDIPANAADWEFRLSQLAQAAQLLSSEPNWVRKLLAKPREPKAKAAPPAPAHAHGHNHEAQPGPSQAFLRRRAAIMNVLGPDWHKIEVRWSKMAKTVAPRFTKRQGEWQPAGARWLLVGTTEASAVVDTCESPPRGDYVIRGTCEFGPVKEPANYGEFRIEFGWDEKTLVGVYLQPRNVTIATWSKERDWHDEHSQHLPELEVGPPFEFRIEVTSQEVRVAIGGAMVCSWSHGGRQTHTGVTLATNSRLVWLQDVQVEPLAPVKK